MVRRQAQVRAARASALGTELVWLQESVMNVLRHTVLALTDILCNSSLVIKAVAMDTRSEEIKVSTAILLTLNELKAVDLAFRLAI